MLMLSMDFHLNLNIRLFIVTGSFITDCRCFLLVMKPQQISAFPCITSHWAFSCCLTMPCTFWPFLKLFSLPGTPSLPYFYLKACPFFCAICKGYLKNLFFFPYIFHLIVNILVFIKAKSPLYFSVICVCPVPFCSTVNTFNSRTLSLTYVISETLCLLLCTLQEDEIELRRAKAYSSPVAWSGYPNCPQFPTLWKLLRTIVNQQIMPVACTGTIMVFPMAPQITACCCSLHSGSCLLMFSLQTLAVQVKGGNST